MARAFGIADVHFAVGVEGNGAAVAERDAMKLAYLRGVDVGSVALSRVPGNSAAGDGDYRKDAANREVRSDLKRVLPGVVELDAR